MMRRLAVGLTAGGSTRSMVRIRESGVALKPSPLTFHNAKAECRGGRGGVWVETVGARYLRPRATRLPCVQRY